MTDVLHRLYSNNIMLCLFHFSVNISEGAIYIFKKSFRIYDHQNWENQYPQEHCDGLVLPIMPMGVITAKQLEIKQLTFGLHMSFIFNDDTDIKFNENSKSIMNCKLLKLNNCMHRVE